MTAPDAIRAVLDAVALDARTHPTVTDMARHAGYSYREFSRRVKRTTGRTAERHLIAARLAQAKTLLALTGLTPNAVAVRVGYRQTAGLHLLFVRELGMSPTAYRRQVRP